MNKERQHEETDLAIAMDLERDASALAHETDQRGKALTQTQAALASTMEHLLHRYIDWAIKENRLIQYKEENDETLLRVKRHIR